MSAIHQMLVAMGVILTLPYLVWRLGRTNAWAPLVVIQILMGIVLGPGLLGAAYPSLYSSIFTDDVLLMLSGIAAWAVILFVWLAGLELDLAGAWAERRDGMVTAACALLFPLMMGAVVGWGLMLDDGRWLGEGARPWQFALGIGMACAVTALPILMLFMRQLGLLRTPLGQRVLRYASIDDIAIWAVLAVVVWDLDGLLRQVGFLIGFIALSRGLRVLIPRLPSSDRWFVGLIWLCWVALSAHWAGLHYMVGAFLAGAVMERNWFEAEHLDRMRDMVLLTLMPEFNQSTGLRTQWA